MLKRWGMLVIGLGIGLIVGPNVGRDLLIPGLVAVAAGVAMVAAGGRTAVDLVQVPPSSSLSPSEGEPKVSGLGDRVHDILRLAEDQARDHRAEAEREAAAIIAEARAEAARIREG
jgi:hypothetical protein